MTLNLPLYNIMPPDETDNLTGMFLVSLVENPAVEVDFLAFENEQIKFSIQDEEKHIITGVAILADVPIYRRDKKGEFYVQFRKNDIPFIVEKFMRNGFANYISLQHDSETVSNKDAVMIESFFINKERGIVPKEFEKVTDGSWMCSYKILNEDIWQLIKAKDVKGFSIEIASNLELAMEKTNESTEDDELMNALKIEMEESTPLPGDIARAIVDTNPIPTNNIILDQMTDASIEYAITNRRVVMLNYDNTGHGGSRQVAITAYGSTTAGNSALRVYQFYGDTASEQGWKIILTGEVSGFHVLNWQGFDSSILPGWRPETQTGEAGTLLNVKYEI